MPTVAFSDADNPKDDMHYPSLYLEWDADYGLPDSGEMTVRFEKRSQTDTKGGKQTVELEITDILDVESEEEEAKEDAGKTLDKYRDETTAGK